MCVNVCVHVPYASMTCFTRSYSHSAYCKGGNAKAEIAAQACPLVRRIDRRNNNNNNNGD